MCAVIPYSAHIRFSLTKRAFRVEEHLGERSATIKEHLHQGGKVCLPLSGEDLQLCSGELLPN